MTNENLNNSLKGESCIDIKRLNEELEKAFENLEIVKNESDVSDSAVEWAYEHICDIEPVLHELKQDEIKEWKEQVDVDEAIENLHKYYKQNKVSVGFPTNTGFKYKGVTYHLMMVIGNVVRIKGNKLFCKYGHKHIFDKHGKETHIVDGGTLASEERLINGINNIETAINEGVPFISKKDPEKLAILYDELLYIICFSSHPHYVTFLHNLFPPKKSYLKDGFKKTYKKTSPVEVVKMTKDDSEKSS